MFLTILISAITMIALTVTQTLPTEIVAVLMPLIVWLATTTINWIRAKVSTGGFGGLVVVQLIVPILSLLVAWIADYALNPGLSFWLLVALGILGTYLSELIKQWTQSLKGEQTRASANILGKKDREILT